MQIGDMTGLRTLWGFITGLGLFGYGVVIRFELVKQDRDERRNEDDVDGVY
jgi:hypothetical protein